jgi:hypothetical protein
LLRRNEKEWAGYGDAADVSPGRQQLTGTALEIGRCLECLRKSKEGEGLKGMGGGGWEWQEMRSEKSQQGPVHAGLCRPQQELWLWFPCRIIGGFSIEKRCDPINILK